MAAATRAKRAKASSSAKVVPADFLRVANDVATNVLIERTAEIRVLMLGLLSGTNVHQLGPPGSAKSLGLRSMSERIVGAKLFAKQLHANMPADRILGGLDMPHYLATGELRINVDHAAPGADIVDLDELTRANGPSLDGILALYNAEERLFESNGGMAVAPVKFFVSSSNFMPAADDPQFGALIDRITLMQYIDYVKADESFKEMFRRHHARRVAEKDGTLEMETITLEQLVAAQSAVDHVEPTPDFLDGYASIRREAMAKGVMVSDRRWMELGRVCRAAAWLAGRDTLVSDDIVAVENGLWREQKDVGVARELVLPFAGAFARKADELRRESAPHVAKWEALRADVEGCPPNEELPQDVIQQAISVQQQLARAKKRVSEALAEAESQQRDPLGVRDLDNEINAIAKWYEKNDLPHTIT